MRPVSRMVGALLALGVLQSSLDRALAQQTQPAPAVAAADDPRFEASNAAGTSATSGTSVTAGTNVGSGTGSDPSIAVADADPRPLDEITVSARRRSENIQDVPIPIAVVSGDDLEAAGRYHIESLNETLPSTNIEYGNPRQMSIAVRGLGNNPANDALESSVGVYLDDVYLGRTEMVNMDLLDIDQLTLLRGPQGTLFGKNTTAGVLNITTRAPTFQAEHDIEASYGDYGYYQVRGTWSQPLTGDLAARLSFAKTFDHGFVRDPVTGRTLDGADRTGGRAQILWKPSEAVSVRLIGDYSEERSDTGAGIVYNPGPDGGAKYYAALAAAGAAVIYDPNFDYTTVNSRQQMDVRQSGGSAELNWQIAQYKLTAITAYRSWWFVPYNDADGTNVTAFSNAAQNVDDNQWTQEIRIASPEDRPLSYVAGLYYFNEHQDNLLHTLYGPDGTAIAALGLGLPSFANGYTQTTQLLGTYSESAFGQLTWRPARMWELSLGLRDTRERKTVSLDRTSVGAATFTNSPNFQDRTLDGLSLDNNGISGLAGASYRITPHVLGYLTLTRGVKSGGVNPMVPVPGLSLAQLYVRPEVADDAELGIKSTLLDHRLVLNADAFWTNVRDYQSSLLVQPNASTNLITIESNIGKVRTRGVEADISAQPWEGLLVKLSASLNDARYLSYDHAPCSAEQLAPLLGPSQKTCTLSGRPVVGAPKWIFDPSVSYEHPLPGGLSAGTLVSYSWRSWFYGSADDSLYGRVPSYGLLDARLILHGGNDGKAPWSLSVWTNNALDKRYVLGGLGVSSALYNYGETPGWPRTYGVTVDVSF